MVQRRDVRREQAAEVVNRETTEAALPDTVIPVHARLKERVVDFAGLASIEVTSHDKDVFAGLAGRLPAGTAIYVTHVPNSTIADVVDVACTAESLGFRAWPHIVARRIENEQSLLLALERMRERGITRALLVAGDLSTPAGTYRSTLDILESGLLVSAGISSIGVAGHPEGHKRIGSTLLWESLRAKQEYGELTGARVHIVSQFGFSPAAVCEWETQLTMHGIVLPVHVGIAGPASLRTLIKYAMLCGIGASLNALMNNLSALSSARHLVTSASEVLLQLVRAREDALAERFVQPHFFSFGGVMQTVNWLEAIRGGNFEVDLDAGTLLVRQ
jgi:methylenetetrahydrofolate reductase (NADPH)